MGNNLRLRTAIDIGFFIILAFVLRIIAITILKTYILDSPVYYEELDTIAQNILSGKGYTYRYLNTTCYFFGDPLYAYFLAIMHLITNKNYLAIAVFQAAIAAFSVIPLIFVANKIFNKRTAYISGLMYCLHPGLIVYAVSIGKFALMACFLLTIIYFMVRTADIKKWNLVIIGLLTGLGILLRPTLIFLIPAFFIYLIVAKKEPIKKIFINLFIVILLAGIVISPWTYRGYKIYNRFIFITLNNWHVFWRGNNPIASGTGFTEDGQAILSAADENFKERLFSLNEIEQHNFFREESMKYIKAHPNIFLKNTVKKFVYFWSFSPQTGLLYPKVWFAIYKLIYFFLAVFFIFGGYFIFMNKNHINIPAIIFLFSFFLIFSFYQSLYYVDTRYRWMIEPLLMIISSYGFVNIFFSSKKSFNC